MTESKRSGAWVIASNAVNTIGSGAKRILRWGIDVSAQASLTQTTLEVMLAAFLWALLYRELNVYQTDASILAFMTVVASCVFLGAFRLARPRGIVTGIAHELTGMFVIIGPTAVVQFWIGSSLGRTELRNAYVPLVVVLADVAVYVVGRFLVVGLPWWHAVQQRKLRWQLVQAHVVVVFVLLSVPITIAFILTFRSTIGWYTDPQVSAVENIVARIAYQVIPVLALIVVLFGAVLVVVLPPSIALSYVIARRMTRRLEHLAAATTAIRDGDYAARVSVRGQDEVAELQTNFNAMAEVLEASLEEVAAERDHISRLLDQRRELVASVSHELRTPLTIIRGYLDSALDRDQRIDPSLEHDLGVMHAEAMRLQRLIDDLFSLSRAEVGSLVLQSEKVDIGLIVRRCVDATSAAAWRTRRVEVLFAVASDLPAYPVDVDRLEQVVINLITNAVRHSAPGGLVQVEATTDNGYLQIDVADTGSGIPPEEIEHIWERFYRGSNTTDARGSGIGLAVVRELTEAMGGDVSVTSTLGEGSRFRLRFPLTDDLANFPAATTQNPAIPATTQ